MALTPLSVRPYRALFENFELLSTDTNIVSKKGCARCTLLCLLPYHFVFCSAITVKLGQSYSSANWLVARFVNATICTFNLTRFNN